MPEVKGFSVNYLLERTAELFPSEKPQRPTAEEIIAEMEHWTTVNVSWRDEIECLRLIDHMRQWLTKKQP
jgi:hypothetical protein